MSPRGWVLASVVVLGTVLALVNPRWLLLGLGALLLALCPLSCVALLVSARRSHDSTSPRPEH